MFKRPGGGGRTHQSGLGSARVRPAVISTQALAPRMLCVYAQLNNVLHAEGTPRIGWHTVSQAWGELGAHFTVGHTGVKALRTYLLAAKGLHLVARCLSPWSLEHSWAVHVALRPVWGTYTEYSTRKTLPLTEPGSRPCCISSMLVLPVRMASAGGQGRGGRNGGVATKRLYMRDWAAGTTVMPTVFVPAMTLGFPFDDRP